MPDVRIEKLIKRFGNVTAIADVDIHIPDGEIVTLLGPSGCGKTTTLRCLAGFENADEGQIWIGEQLIFDSKQNINLSPRKEIWEWYFSPMPSGRICRCLKISLSPFESAKRPAK
jgi:ABC-type Fe3+/spermidine/putrescine transport system ATPase subunit